MVGGGPDPPKVGDANRPRPAPGRATRSRRVRTFDGVDITDIPSPVVAVDQVTQPFASTGGPGLDAVSFTVERGEWVAIMGRSGSGKSTLLRLLGGLDAPAGGTIDVAGVRLSDLGATARARFRQRHVGFVFQQYNLVDDLTAAANVELVLALAGRHRGRRAEARRLLDDLGVGSCADRLPSRLSGGEQQRVAIARASAARPAVLLADEPTGALDSESAEVVLGLLGAARRHGQAIVMVTHDANVAAAADRVLWMHDGHLSATRTSEVAA